MHTDISFRRAAKADIARIKEILFHALHQYQIVLPKDYPVGDIDAIGTDHDRGASFVLLRGGRVIGFVVLRPVSNDTMALKRLYLDATERKKGLGRQMLANAVQFARQAGYSQMSLETASKFGEAVRLYRQCGFREQPDVRKAPGHDLALIKAL